MTVDLLTYLQTVDHGLVGPWDRLTYTKPWWEQLEAGELDPAYLRRKLEEHPPPPPRRYVYVEGRRYLEGEEPPRRVPGGERPPPPPQTAATIVPPREDVDDEWLWSALEEFKLRMPEPEAEEALRWWDAQLAET